MKHYNYLFALALLSLGTQSATAGSFNFSGNLSQDDSVQFFSFTLSSPSIIQIDTTSYVGGGFTPVLSLWDSTGLSFGSVAGNASDALWTVDLSYSTPNPIGVYYLGLSENPNVAGGQNISFLPGGIPNTSIFSMNGLGDYTGLAVTGNCFSDQSGGFYQTDPNPASTTGCLQRTSAFSLNISGTGINAASLYPAPALPPSTSVPEPAVLALTLAGLTGMAGFTRRRPA